MALQIFEPIIATGNFPVDDRYVVESLDELYAEETWAIYDEWGDIESWKTYEGLLVTVVDINTYPPNCELYLCVCFDDPTNPNSWRKISPVENSSVNIEWENDLDNFSDLINNEEQENNGEEQNNSEDPTPRQEESGE